MLDMLKTPRSRDFNTFSSVSAAPSVLSFGASASAAPLDDEATRRRYAQVLHPEQNTHTHIHTPPDADENVFLHSYYDIHKHT